MYLCSFLKGKECLKIIVTHHPNTATPKQPFPILILHSMHTLILYTGHQEYGRFGVFISIFFMDRISKAFPHIFIKILATNSFSLWRTIIDMM